MMFLKGVITTVSVSFAILPHNVNATTAEERQKMKETVERGLKSIRQSRCGNLKEISRTYGGEKEWREWHKQSVESYLKFLEEMEESTTRKFSFYFLEATIREKKKDKENPYVSFDRPSSDFISTAKFHSLNINRGESVQVLCQKLRYPGQSKKLLVAWFRPQTGLLIGTVKLRYLKFNDDIKLKYDEFPTPLKQGIPNFGFKTMWTNFKQLVRKVKKLKEDESVNVEEPMKSSMQNFCLSEWEKKAKGDATMRQHDDYLFYERTIRLLKKLKTANKWNDESDSSKNVMIDMQIKSIMEAMGNLKEQVEQLRTLNDSDALDKSGDRRRLCSTAGSQVHRDVVTGVSSISLIAVGALLAAVIYWVTSNIARYTKRSSMLIPRYDII